MSNNTVRKWPVPVEEHRKLTGIHQKKKLENFWSEYCIHFRRFSMFFYRIMGDPVAVIFYLGYRSKTL